MNLISHLKFLNIEGLKIATFYRDGYNKPGIVWLNGYASNMFGAKAESVDILAKELEISALRYDYSGHGLSDGQLIHGTISLWTKQSLYLFNYFTKGPQILIGSSMGGWIALKMAIELKKKNIQLYAIILISPAPDFTKNISISRPKLHHIPYNKEFIEDGKKNFVMNELIDFECPVYILQGMQDVIISYKDTIKFIEKIPCIDSKLILIKDGNHNLSRDKDICILKNIIRNLVVKN